MDKKYMIATPAGMREKAGFFRATTLAERIGAKWMARWERRAGEDVFLYWPIWNGRRGRCFVLSHEERRSLRKDRTLRIKLAS